jgi:hypothetical protein
MSTPYLMHQVLAMSALHLSIIRPERRTFYHQHATGLQARAISIFNEAHPRLDLAGDDVLEIFLFSSLLVLHLLCDTFYYERQSSEHFFQKITQFLPVYRGVMTVVAEGRDKLSATEVGSRLELARRYTSTDPQGLECAALYDMLDSTELEADSRRALNEAINYLQQMIDAQQSGPVPERTRVPVFVTWLIILSPEYMDLLRQRSPQALVVFAHFAILLHRGRSLWVSVVHSAFNTGLIVSGTCIRTASTDGH